MSELTCPTCGEMNPDFLDRCQACKSPLHPEEDGQFLHPGQAPIKIDTSQLPKLGGSRNNEPIRAGDAPVKKNTAELEKVLPPWLKSMRERKSDKPTTGQISPPEGREDLANASTQPPGEEVPDWLAGLERESTGEEDGELPSWLANLRGKKVEPVFPDEEESPRDAVEPGKPEEATAGEGSFPDWLTGLEPEKREAAETPAEPAPAVEGGIPDWLAALKADQERSQQAFEAAEETPFEAAAPAAEGGVPDWLSAMQAEAERGQEAFKEAAETPLEGETPAVEGGVPDWLVAMQAEQGRGYQDTAGGPGEVPDWLAGLEGGGEAPAEAPIQPEAAEAPIEPAGARGGDTDWLAQLQADQERGLQELESRPRGTEEWLSGLPLVAMTPAEEPVEQAAAPAAEGVPEWLADLKADQEHAMEVVESGAGEVPEWISGIPAVTEAGGIEPTVAVPSEAAPGAVPDWLADLVDKSVTAGAPSKPPFEAEAVEEQAKPAAIPDWLAGLAPQEGAGGPPAFVEEGQAEAAAPVPAEEAFTMEAPGWLSSLKAEEQAAGPVSTPAEGEAPAAELEAVVLPDWVQAMRPIESAVEEAVPQEAEEAAIENRGPLAGLKGVLPAGPGLIPSRKPPAYSIKLLPSEGQQRHAAHLEQMVQAESQAGEVVKAGGSLAGRILRWVVAAILVLVVALPVVLGTQSVPPFSGFPSEMGPTINQIDSLPANPAVLVVLDYEPAFVGEMHAAAGPLVDYLLITKGARLVLVSSLPAGPALGEWFLRSTQSVHGYQAGQQYVNLGYLAGGTSGIAGFIQDPVRAAPARFDGQEAWSLPPLAGVDSLGDFTMMIVLTDSSDTGRTWVEQLAQSTGTKPPMVMAVSAQAEPMIRPYFDAGQIQGLVVGLSGGQALEALSRPGVARTYWDAFSYGLLAAVILMVVGGAWSALSGLFGRKPEAREGQD